MGPLRGMYPSRRLSPLHLASDLGCWRRRWRTGRWQRRAARKGFRSPSASRGACGSRSALQMLEMLSWQVVLETTKAVELARARGGAAHHALERLPGGIPVGGRWPGVGRGAREWRLPGDPWAGGPGCGCAAAAPGCGGGGGGGAFVAGCYYGGTGLPDPVRCARVASWLWAGEESDRSRLCRDQMMVRLTEVVAVALDQAEALHPLLLRDEALSWAPPVEAASLSPGDRHASARAASRDGLLAVPPRASGVGGGRGGARP